MTAINTNTASMNAQHYLAKANKEMESSMAKLSSGLKVNSAADDAAGLAIASRMTSQIKGINMAIKNANDTVALAQTAEGAMEEVTNMLQRMRELAVQSANGTMNDSDRASLDAEVQALKTEIDRVANYTQFNNQNLLDGSFNKTFQIGDKSGQTVDLSIASVSTSSLGMSGGSSGDNVYVSGRIADASAIEAGDIEINGQALGAFATTDDMEDVLNNINTNVDNVTATGFNIVTAATIGNGITGAAGADGNAAGESDADGLMITVTELGQSAATVFKISASADMAELVSNINNETGGVVAASVNSEGKLVLSNNTGAAITVEDDSTSAGSGFTSTSTTYNGFIKLESDDGSSIRIDAGNAHLVSAGSAADVQKLGFNVTTKTTQNDSYTVIGTEVTSPEVAFARGDLKINGVDMFDSNIDTTSLTGKLNVINSFSATTGVSASASLEKTIALTTSEIVEGDTYEINGYQITIGSTTTAAGVAALFDATMTTATGLTATSSGDNLTISGENVQTLTINNVSTADKTTALASAVGTTSAQTDNKVITIADADVKEGRVFQLVIGSDGAGAAASGTFTYTAAASDTAEEVANGLKAAMAIGSGSAFTGGGQAHIAVADVASGNTLTFDNASANLNNGNATYTFSRTDNNDLFRSGQTSGTATVVAEARIKLDSTNNSPILIDVGENETDAAATHGFIEQNVGAADFDTNTATMGTSGSSMVGLSIASSANANSALGQLDNAIDTVNSIRSDLGALQNRLDHTINNLSSVSNNTEGAKGRIMDTDFASETANLTKQQILSQAATSMLAQANQSKQGILALLQG